MGPKGGKLNKFNSSLLTSSPPFSPPTRKPHCKTYFLTPPRPVVPARPPLKAHHFAPPYRLVRRPLVPSITVVPVRPPLQSRSSQPTPTSPITDVSHHTMCIPDPTSHNPPNPRLPSRTLAITRCAYPIQTCTITMHLFAECPSKRWRKLRGRAHQSKLRRGMADVGV